MVGDVQMLDKGLTWRFGGGKAESLDGWGPRFDVLGARRMAGQNPQIILETQVTLEIVSANYLNSTYSRGQATQYQTAVTSSKLLS